MDQRTSDSDDVGADARALADAEPGGSAPAGAEGVMQRQEVLAGRADLRGGVTGVRMGWQIIHVRSMEARQ
jgi:hypothetical protein